MENKPRLIALSLLVIAALASTPAAQSRSPLKGAWKASSVSAGPNSQAIVGLAIFGDNHYSIMWFDATNERPDIANVGSASADDMRKLWNGWVANTGTYEVNGDLVTIHPMGAKNPVVMKPGATEVYRFRIDVNTLSWTQQRNARGVEVTGAATAKFVRQE
jgi:hypothetical protein